MAGVPKHENGSYPVIARSDERRTLNIERPTSNEKQTSLAAQGAPISVFSSFPI
jgi:hypothetical protein